MFGRHKLTHDGIATVVSCSNAAHNMAITGAGYTRCEYDLVVDVQTDGVPPFRTETSHWFADLFSPNPGDQLTVRCNPETKDVEIDISRDPRFDPALHMAAEQHAIDAQRAADLAAPPGTPPAGQGPQTGWDDGLDPELRALMQNEENERRGGGSPTG
ncbi:MAG: hypothetical protein JWM34_4621 [Ilumatobacteraceae bacterium]|nr:hypothetical protein [Ilumatobacteraceae bacterium]